MRFFKFSKGDKAAMIVVAVLILLVIGLTVATKIVSGKSKSSTTQSTTEAVTEATTELSSETSAVEDATATTTVTAVSVDDIPEEEATAEYNDMSQSDITNVLTSSEGWTGYLSPDHTNEDYWKLSIDGDKWIITYDDGNGTTNTYEYTVKINSTVDLNTLVTYSYTVNCTVTYDSQEYNVSLKLTYDDLGDENVLVLRLDSPFACDGFKCEV